MEDYETKQITMLIADLKRTGDERAAQRIWDEYFEKLVRLARQKMRRISRRVDDEEDVALSAINSVIRGAKEDRFPQLEDRTDLWKLLVCITKRKVEKGRRMQFANKRGAGRVRGDSVFVKADGEDDAGGFQQVVDPEPTPEEAAMLNETIDDCFERLDNPDLQQVAQYKLEGYTNQEITEKLGCGKRTVIRRLNLIRMKWSGGTTT